MSDTFKYFPSSDKEAIALLYVQNQDLSGKSVEEVYRMYKDALNALKNAAAASW